MRSSWMMILVGAAVVTALCVPAGEAQQKSAAKQTGLAVNGDWPLYRHDLAGSGYSPLAQITVQNAGGLMQVWSYRLTSDTPAPAAKGKGKGGGGGNSEATPIVVNGVMFLPAANRVIALEPESGKEIWNYPVEGGAPSRRGVAYMPAAGGNPPRILFTAGRRLIALDANTGNLDPGFGKEGEVDMVVPYNSVPMISVLSKLAG